MKQYNTSNFAVFSVPMCTLLFHSVPQQAIYNFDGKYGSTEAARARFAETHWQKVRENIQFNESVLSSDSDKQKMQVLRWLHFPPTDQTSIDGHLELLLG